MALIRKICRKIIYMYERAEENEARRQLARCGENARISYPFVISHSELIEIGRDSVILSRCRLQVYPERTGVNAKIEIGKSCFIGYGFCALAGENICIGDNVTIASKVCIVSENHSFDPLCEKNYGEQELTIAPVNIEDGCWIGEGVTILPGVTIGKKSVVGAGSVVVKDIPAYCIAVGNPARVIKEYDFSKKRWKKI